MIVSHKYPPTPSSCCCFKASLTSDIYACDINVARLFLLMIVVLKLNLPIALKTHFIIQWLCWHIYIGSDILSFLERWKASVLVSHLIHSCLWSSCHSTYLLLAVHWSAGISSLSSECMHSTLCHLHAHAQVVDHVAKMGNSPSIPMTPIANS